MQRYTWPRSKQFLPVTKQTSATQPTVAARATSRTRRACGRAARQRQDRRLSRIDDPHRHCAPRPGAEAVGRDRAREEPPELPAHGLVAGKTDAETMRALDEAVNQLDLVVADLQSAVMKTRMQPIGRLFQKYPRMARDLARQLGKEVELELSGEETELDNAMIEDLADPLIHLVRNAVDHGIETPEERTAQGKPARSMLRLTRRAGRRSHRDSDSRRRPRHEPGSAAPQGRRKRADRRRRGTANRRQDACSSSSCPASRPRTRSAASPDAASAWTS